MFETRCKVKAKRLSSPPSYRAQRMFDTISSVSNILFIAVLLLDSLAVVALALALALDVVTCDFNYIA